MPLLQQDVRINFFVKVFLSWNSRRRREEDVESTWKGEEFYLISQVCNDTPNALKFHISGIISLILIAYRHLDANTRPQNRTISAHPLVSNSALFPKDYQGLRGHVEKSSAVACLQLRKFRSTEAKKKMVYQNALRSTATSAAFQQNSSKNRHHWNSGILKFKSSIFYSIFFVPYHASPIMFLIARYRVLTAMLRNPCTIYSASEASPMVRVRPRCI